MVNETWDALLRRGIEGNTTSTWIAKTQAMALSPGYWPPSDFVFEVDKWGIPTDHWVRFLCISIADAVHRGEWGEALDFYRSLERQAAWPDTRASGEAEGG